MIGPLTTVILGRAEGASPEWIPRSLAALRPRNDVPQA